ncbi:MAG: SpoIIE family protein phosphatase, partial [Acidimicrobiales bacterium]
MTDDDSVELEEREDALWRLASSLAGSVTLRDVAQSLVNEAGRAAGGTFANLALLVSGAGAVKVLHQSSSETGPAGTREFDLEATVPACDAIRTGLPVLLGSIDEIGKRYPGVLTEITAAGLSARATLPLHAAHGGILGAIGIGWQLPQNFDVPQLRRLDLVAQLVALAVERAQMVQPGQRAEELGRALETMPHAFFSVGSDFCIAQVNSEGARLLHSTQEELKGKNLLDFPETAGRAFEAHYRKAMSMEQPVVFEEYHQPMDTWFEVHAWPARRGLNIYFSDVSNRHDLERHGAFADIGPNADINRLRILTVVAEHLVGSADRTEVLQRLTQVLVPDMADWCTIVTPADEALVRVAARHVDPPLDDLAQRLVGSYPHEYSGPSPGVVVYKSAEPLRMARLVEEIIRDLDDSIASTAYGRTLLLLGDGPGLITPVIVDGDVQAVITMIRRTGDGFSDEDVAVMTEVASHVAVALVSADHVQNQHETARALQAAALPSSLPESANLQMAAGYRPASDGGQVGGDWYDAFELETGRIAIVVGDVAGHGIGAAALTAQMRNVLRANLFSGVGPLRSLSKLSHLMATQEPDALATIVCAEVDPVTGDVTWASAGHPAPIVVSRPGVSAYLPGRPALPIGCTNPSPSEETREHRLTLERGSRLFLFTDGLYERRRVDLDIGLAHLMILAEQSLSL